MTVEKDPARRDVLFVRVTPAEKERLETVAAHHGLTQSAVVRMLVKHEHERIAKVMTEPKPLKKAARR